jgi:CheY-like chemotaxis protein
LSGHPTYDRLIQVRKSVYRLAASSAVRCRTQGALQHWLSSSNERPMCKSILLVDDSPVVRALIRRHLEFHPSLEVCGEASDGIEAVEKAQELSPDLIVMDFSMPRMNGLEAARTLKQKVPQVPIILFTVHDGLVRVSDAREAGIWAVVFKFQADNLLPQVLDLLERSEQVASATVGRCPLELGAGIGWRKRIVGRDRW